MVQPLDPPHHRGGGDRRCILQARVPCRLTLSQEGRERDDKRRRERECGTVVLPSTGNETATTIPGTCRVVLSIGLRYLTMYALGYLCLLLFAFDCAGGDDGLLLPPRRAQRQRRVTRTTTTTDTICRSVVRVFLVALLRSCARSSTSLLSGAMMFCQGRACPNRRVAAASAKATVRSGARSWQNIIAPRYSVGGMSPVESTVVFESTPSFRFPLVLLFRSTAGPLLSIPRPSLRMPLFGVDGLWSRFDLFAAAAAAVSYFAGSATPSRRDTPLSCAVRCGCGTS